MEEKTLNPIFTSQDLMEQIFEPPQWIIEDLIPEGLTILSGAPKIGKSWLALQIANAVATKEPLFGRKVLTERCVLVIALEDNARRLHSRMKKGHFTGSEKLAFCVQWRNGLKGLGDFLKQNQEIDLVIIDTLAIFSPSDASRGSNVDESDVRRMVALHQIVQETNTSIIVIHHDKQGEEGDWAQKINGSNGIIGTVDTLIRLSVNKRGSKEGNLHITGRDVEDIELLLQLEENLMRWGIDKNRDDKPLTPLQRDVLNLIPGNPETISSKSVSESLSREQAQISDILSKLRNAGHVESPAWGRYTKPKT